MTEALITDAREYLESVAESYVSNTVIERWLNKSREYVDKLQIYPEDYGYDNESPVYHVGYMYLMNVVLTDGDGNTISTDDYSIDEINGIVTFDGSPLVIPDSVFITFTYHNFFEAVSQCWLYMAAKARIQGSVQLGDEVLPKDYTYKEYCISKYWEFRQSDSFQIER